MKGILYAASEGLPFCKSGGLADVIGSLPLYLDHKKYKLAVIMPMYKNIIVKHPELVQVASYRVQSGVIDKEAALYHVNQNDVDYYFVREDSYFYRDSMYGYADDGERFAFFDKAVLLAIYQMKFKIDIIHNHDWQTGMIPIMAKKEFKDETINRIKHVFTIHNLAFQGNFPPEMMACFNLDQKYFRNGDVRFDGGISFMKAAITYADKITTVSNTYANEILTSEYGEHMEAALSYRRNDLWGIVNGIDTKQWNPATDACIHVNYDEKSVTANKKKNKKYIQKSLGLREADDVILIGIVSRLTWQKGLSLLLEKMNTLMGMDVQLIILGTGDSMIENQLRRIETDFPHRAVFYCGYDEALSHSIYAGLDVLLMPSLFEPCGISQLIAMRYGTIPLVRETGGLKDTVEPFNEYENTGTGFSFRNFNGDDFMHIVRYAVDTYYYNKAGWKKLIHNAMNKDVSWNWSADKYSELYEGLF